jgi:hypothetical protein
MLYEFPDSLLSFSPLLVLNKISCLYRIFQFWIHSILPLQDYYTPSQSDRSEFFRIVDSLYLSSKFLDCWNSSWIVFVNGGDICYFSLIRYRCPFKHWLMVLLNIRYSFSAPSFSTYPSIYIFCHSWETLSLFPHPLFQCWLFLLLSKSGYALTFYSALCSINKFL